MIKFGLRNITIKDVLISVLILVVTFGYQLDKFIEKGTTQMDFFGLTIHSFEFIDFASFIYFIKMKLLIIIFSIIWFFTCRHWWRSAILVITCIELMKLISVMKADQIYLDEIEYYTSLPVTIPIILLIIILSKKINDFNYAKNLRLELDNKINDVFFEINEKKKSDMKILKNNFINLKKNEKLIDDKSKYLQELIEMRNKFYDI